MKFFCMCGKELKYINWLENYKKLVMICYRKMSKFK